ncbi:hypothetical protein FisN_25Hh186 [Fistulifera solaris]|jgi:metal transporter CNNM|uniref:CNNM transmembrane domain-containing protein n=1 Tax=Fistulifera solaris TaxID=1519565 RepID=A0A1Z5JWI7_FISSO|nr:hypothetical protein FisN_25Hh186 [Fistulifera solaris]|eukprot:GAX18202.1 hypothetical protein FisN_25Hh186 [Fistulifera solaris]
MERFLRGVEHIEVVAPEMIQIDIDRDWFVIRNIVGVLITIATVGLISGLFLGLLTLDALDLQIMERASLDEDEKVYARELLPVVQNRHRLLVSLLVLNALAYESMPIFLDALVPSWVAIILSVTLILLFGEILPSAIFTGPNQLKLGYYSIPLVQVFLVITAPIAVPLAKLLDYMVHDGPASSHHHEPYNRGELSALVRIQYEERMASQTRRRGMKPQERKATQWANFKKEMLQAVTERFEENEIESTLEPPPLDEQLTPPLHRTEVHLIEGSLQMKTKVTMDIYTPLRHVYAVPDNMILDKDNISAIYSYGFSRIPVYRATEPFLSEAGHEPLPERSRMIGYLMTRQLMLIDWDHKRQVSSLPIQKPLVFSPRANLVDVLSGLRSRGVIMGFVCARTDIAKQALNNNQPIPVEAGFMGILTLEDVMESILQDRIYDEFDMKERDRAVATLQRWAATRLQKFVRKKQKERRFSANGTTERTPLLRENSGSFYST